MIKDLTEGNPQKVLWQFTIPMFISVIFQQLYNIADSVIAGKFAGEDALAAVGASYPITMIFMAIAVGEQCRLRCRHISVFWCKRIWKNENSGIYDADIVGSLIHCVNGCRTFRNQRADGDDSHTGEYLC